MEGRTPSRWVPPLLVGAVFSVLGFRLFRLIDECAVNVFFWDPWDFNSVTLFERGNLWQMFDWQHGPHRQGVGALVQVAVEPLYGWSSRGEAFTAGAIVAAAALGALALEKRLLGRLSYAAAIIPISFLTPAQYESLVVTTNFSHGPLPLLLLVVYCLAWTVRRAALRYSLVVVVSFLTTYTGFGFFVGPLTPLLLGVDHWTTAREARIGTGPWVVALGLSLVSLASFFYGYKWQPAADCVANPAEPLLGYGAFAALMLAHAAGAREAGIGAQLTGTALLAVVFVSLLWSARRLVAADDGDKRRFLVTAALASYALLFCFGTAYGRLCLGVGTALSSRYTNYVTLGVLGLYLSALFVDRRRTRAVLLLLLAGVAAAGSLPTQGADLARIGGTYALKSSWRSCYRAFHDVERCDRQTGAGVYPRPDATHLKAKLDYLERTGLNLFYDPE
jgi:hypothetical protein